MAGESSAVNRRRFLAAVAKTGQAAAVPMFVPGPASAREAWPPMSGSRWLAWASAHAATMCSAVLSDRGGSAICGDCRHPEGSSGTVKTLTEKQYGSGVATYRDFREMLSRPDIDAVLIATGDRWHTLASICAAKAGKDIYCEKPCSMTIAESQALADTMQRYGRVYQAGTQRRSLPNFVFAVELCHSGKLGKLTAVHANTLHPGTSHDWLPGQPEPPKDEIDWDLWLGPTPWRPYNRQYVDGGWRNFFDFHGGGILEWGADTVDQCNWAASQRCKNCPCSTSPPASTPSPPRTGTGRTRPAASPRTMTA